MAFSPDGTRVLTGSVDQTARLWETSTGRLLSTLQGHTDWVRSMAFSPDGTRVLTGSRDQTARLWETSTGCLLSTLQGHTSWWRSVSVAFSPDGKLIITRDKDRVLFWSACEPELGRLLGMYVATYEVRAVYWQDVTHLVLADADEYAGQPHFYQLELEGNWRGD